MRRSTAKSCDKGGRATYHLRWQARRSMLRHTRLTPASSARGRTCQVQRNILDGGNDPPQFAQAGQNITAAAMLLRGLPEPIVS